MAKERTAVKKIKEVLRLAEVPDIKHRKIARSTGVSRPVVAALLEKAHARGVTYAQVEALDDEAVERLFYTPVSERDNKRLADLLDRFPCVSRELLRVGVTLRLLWEEYRREEPDGFGYSQYCKHYQQWREASDVSFPIDHKPGEKAYVDFTGMKWPYFEGLGGEPKAAEIFLSILPASQYFYVEACENQTDDVFARLNENAFYFFHGVTALLSPDNLKAAVDKPCRYEPEINKTFGLFAEHYHVTVLPARVRHPKDKALVENAVLRTYQNIFAPLRDEVFYSLGELNSAIRRQLCLFLGKPMKRFGLSRRELFEQQERSTLTPLPPERFPWRHHTQGYVQYNYHIFFKEDLHFYSAPWQLYKQKVDVYTTVKTIEIYHKGKRVASHVRSKAVNRYTTDPAHMPEKHRHQADWTPERFTSWAGSVGESVERMVRSILAAKRHPQAAFRSCMGLINLSRRGGYDRERLEVACAYALRYGNVGYGAVKRILENGYDKSTQEPFPEEIILQHENVRGADYYKNTGIKT